VCGAQVRATHHLLLLHLLLTSRCYFFLTMGVAHSIVGGSAWEPTPWRAVQQAAWKTLESLTRGQQ